MGGTASTKKAPRGAFFFMVHATQLQKVLTPTVWHVLFDPSELRMNVDPPIVVAVDPFEPKM